MERAVVAGAALSLCLVTASGCSGSGAPGTVRNAGGSVPAVAGHRGNDLVAPENTLHSFRAAYAAGVPVVETDVQFDRDGVPLISHDATTRRRTTCNLVIAHAAFASWRRCNAAKGYPYFERMPTLDEMMADVAAHHAAALIELKPTTTRGQTARFVDLWAKHRAYDWATVISFIPGDLDAVHAADGRIHTALLTAKLPDLATAHRYGEVDVLHTAVTPRFTAAMHAIGVKVIVWTADDPADWGRLTADHVDLITTNKPAEYLRFARR